jgi:hypothetical protein
MANEYSKVIEACTSLATIASIQNKLNKIFISTDDSTLHSFQKPVLDNLVQAQRTAASRKISGQKVQCNLSQPPFKALADYCKVCVLSKKPQWQIIAEQHGWSKN